MMNAAIFPVKVHVTYNVDGPASQPYKWPYSIRLIDEWESTVRIHLTKAVYDDLVAALNKHAAPKPDAATTDDDEKEQR